MANINERVGNKIKKLRKKTGFSQEQIALNAKKDFTSINEIETGRRNPSLRTIYKIALALKVGVKDLFDF
jgi:transcriptional regulator with XRE-family HTH domain